MAQIDVERGQEFRKCIECFLCQDTCHVVRDHEDNKPAFAGPRFFLRYAELDMHPLDTHDRRKLAQDAAGLGMCNITKCCTEVCPEGIKITDNAIIPMKERVVDRKYDPLVWLGNKIGLRDQGRRGPHRGLSPASAPASSEHPDRRTSRGGEVPDPPRRRRGRPGRSRATGRGWCRGTSPGGSGARWTSTGGSRWKPKPHGANLMKWSSHSDPLEFVRIRAARPQ